MPWEWWLTLSPQQRASVVAVFPVSLLILDLLLKKGFDIPTDSAGADLCLAAVTLDLSQLFFSAGSANLAAHLLVPLVGLTLFHIILWVAALRAIQGPRLMFSSWGSPPSPWRPGVGWALGLLSCSLAFGAVAEVRQALLHGAGRG